MNLVRIWKAATLLAATGAILPLCGKVDAQTSSDFVPESLSLKQTLIFSTIIAVLGAGFLFAVAIAIRLACSKRCSSNDDEDEAEKQQRRSQRQANGSADQLKVSTTITGEQRLAKNASGGTAATVESDLIDADSRHASQTAVKENAIVEDNSGVCHEEHPYADADTSHVYIKPDRSDPSAEQEGQEYTTYVDILDQENKGSAPRVSNTYTTADKLLEQISAATAELPQASAVPNRRDRTDGKTVVVSQTYATADNLEQLPMRRGSTLASQTSAVPKRRDQTDGKTVVGSQTYATADNLEQLAMRRSSTLVSQAEIVPDVIAKQERTSAVSASGEFLDLNGPTSTLGSHVFKVTDKQVNDGDGDSENSNVYAKPDQHDVYNEYDDATIIDD